MNSNRNIQNKEKKNGKNNENKESTGYILKGRSFYLTAIILIVLIYLLITRIFDIKELTWNKFKDEMLLKGDVSSIDIINKEFAEIYIREDSLEKSIYSEVSKNFLGGRNPGPHFRLSIGSVETFESKVDDAIKLLANTSKPEIRYSNRTSPFSIFLSWVIPAMAIIFLLMLFTRRLPESGSIRSAMDFGKSRPEVYEKGKSTTIRFKDIAGYKEAKEEIMEVVDFLKNPNFFTRLGAKIPKGILLIGAPGTGKTLMAKAVAGESGVPFFSLSGAEFIEMFVGVGASRVRDLFEQAKSKAPSIIFIDEIDTIGRVRSKALSIQTNDERDSTLNQLLSEMDGFDPNSGIIVLAATNRADILDPALLRPGRFDRHIHLDLPTKDERLEIFMVHLKPLVLDKELDPKLLAEESVGFSGADIANVCNEAALIAAREKATEINRKHFTSAIDRIIGGLEKRSRYISPEERNRIAYHESGHAIVSWYLKHTDPLQKITIIPRGKSIGASWYLPEERLLLTKSQLMDRICALLGGRVAEEIVFNEVSSGAMDDLEKATRLAYSMVTNLGFSDMIGNISYHFSNENNDNMFIKPYSESTAIKIDEEVFRFIKEASSICRNLLEEKRDKLERLARLLLEKEILFKDEIEVILGSRSHDN